MIEALIQIGDGKDAQAVPLLRELAEAGDAEAKFALAGEYLLGQDGIPKNEKECIKLLKDAADNDGFEPAAGMLSAIYYEGIGTRRNYAESAHYAKMVTADETNDTEPWKGIVYNILGLMSQYGRGTVKNIPSAWHLFQFAVGLGSKDAQENLINLKHSYPMNSDGKINLKPKGRSKWLTFFLVVFMLITALAAYLTYNDGMTVAPLACATFSVLCLLMLCWVPYSIYGFLVFAVADIVRIVMLLTLDGEPGVDNESLAFNMLLIPSLLILLASLKRKKGYAHVWNILNRQEYDGRGPWEVLTSTLLAYGKGEDYKTGSAQTKTANIVMYVVSALLLAMAAYTGWQIANCDFSFDIEWNCFKSPKLYGSLCFVGFFLQFFDWTHFSYVTYWKWKDEYGEEHIERDRDISTEIEGSILMPILGHLVIAPMGYGAVLYYVLMGGFALIQSIMPWLLGALILASAYLTYSSLQSLLDRRFRFLLIPGLGLIYFFIYLILAAVAH